MSKIVTFYGYQGGIGQSMALANTATLLTRWGYRILVIDWDLEAPGGVEHFFASYAVSYQKRGAKGILELLSANAEPNFEEIVPGGSAESSLVAGERSQPATSSWKDWVLTIDLSGSDGDQEGGKLHLLTAGRWRTGNYYRKLSEFNPSEFYARGGGGAFIEQLRTEWKASYDFVLVDCRSGITQFGSICTIQLPDILVLLLPSNDHGLAATVNVAKRVTAARRRLPFERVQLLTIPVPAHFDQPKDTSENQSGLNHQERWLRRFEEATAQFFGDWLPKTSKKKDMLLDTMIPYQPKSIFDAEPLPSLRRQVPTNKGIARGFESVAALLANDLHEANRLHTDREGYVNQAWKHLSWERIQYLHGAWLDSKGTSGKQADLTGRNFHQEFHGRTLVHARLREAIFANADLNSTNLFGADIIYADFSGANLEKANLKNVKGKGANFRGASLREAMLAKADLTGANFQTAKLNKADLEDAQLYRASLKEASLQDVTGLTAKQFRGVNLERAKLPSNLTDYPKYSVGKARRQSLVARGLFYLLAGLCVYASYIVLFGTNSVLLFNNGNLGRMGLNAPAIWFFRLVPVYLIFLYLLLLIMVHRVWENLVELPAIFPDGSTLNEKLSDWFTAAIAYPYLGGRPGAIPKWQRLSLNLLTRGLMPATQFLFLWRTLSLRNWWIYSFHAVLVAFSIGLGWSYQRSGAKILQTNNTGEHWHFDHGREDLNEFKQAA